MLAKLRRLSKLNAPDGNSADSGILAVRRGRAFEVAKGKLEAPIFRMVVVSDGEGDVDRIAGKKLGSWNRSAMCQPRVSNVIFRRQVEFSFVGPRFSVTARRSLRPISLASDDKGE